MQRARRQRAALIAAVFAMLSAGMLPQPAFAGSLRFNQQGPKLLGLGMVDSAKFGSSVALSADGNTAILGGPDDGSTGAAWVFIRTNGVWDQQGAKLVANDATGGAQVGF